LLQYLNVNTRTSYLARLRNPNPRMPDAARIGVASLDHGDKRSHDKTGSNSHEQDKNASNAEGKR